MGPLCSEMGVLLGCVDEGGGGRGCRVCCV